jgi:hypothetical protein
MNSGIITQYEVDKYVVYMTHFEIRRSESLKCCTLDFQRLNHFQLMYTNLSVHSPTSSKFIISCLVSVCKSKADSTWHPKLCTEHNKV